MSGLKARYDDDFTVVMSRTGIHGYLNALVPLARQAITFPT